MLMLTVSTINCNNLMFTMSLILGIDYHHGSTIGSRMGSRIGSVLGSLHGSVCGSVRGSPSPLMPPVSMMHTNHHVDATQ